MGARDAKDGTIRRIGTTMTTTKATKANGTKSAKSTVLTKADGYVTMTIGAFTDAVRAAEAAGTDAVRKWAVTLFAASKRKDVTGYSGTAGKGGYAWYVTVAGGTASKGRHSQYVNYGRWLDAAERIGKPELVASEYDARALQSAAGKAKAKDAAGFLTGYDRDGVDALVSDRVTEPKAKAKDAGSKSGKAVALTANALADAIGDMVVAALAHADTTPASALALRSALVNAARLCEGTPAKVK
jgi:hypothetical protein